jgi:hypothetical protein
MVVRMTRTALLLALVLGLAACGGSSDPEPAAEPEPPPTTTEAEPTTTEPEDTVTDEAETTTEEEPETTGAAPKPLPGLPRFTAGYTEWATLATDIPPRDSDPHLGTKDVFASKEIRGNRFPAGTVIVKHARRPDADFIGLIATMRKVDGADPAHNDWVFVEYTRDSADEPFTELARDSVCWNCHVGAEQADYVWVLAD